MLEDIAALSPVNFFTLEANCRYSSAIKAGPLEEKYSLPITEDICLEDAFAGIALAWNEAGLAVDVQVTQLATKSFYPNVNGGDAVELFFDTRDVKTSGFNTKFCHHFFFLPNAVDSISAGEITRFRTGDIHELCDSQNLSLIVTKQRKGYSMYIFIPKECLHGYDPKQFQRLGFTYRISSCELSPQHFSVVTEDYTLEQQPSLWSTLRLSS